jgi:hypothetical protein
MCFHREKAEKRLWRLPEEKQRTAEQFHENIVYFSRIRFLCREARNMRGACMTWAS